MHDDIAAKCIVHVHVFFVTEIAIGIFVQLKTCTPKWTKSGKERRLLTELQLTSTQQLQLPTTSTVIWQMMTLLTSFVHLHYIAVKPSKTAGAYVVVAIRLERHFTHITRRAAVISSDLPLTRVFCIALTLFGQRTPACKRACMRKLNVNVFWYCRVFLLLLNDSFTHHNAVQCFDGLYL